MLDLLFINDIKCSGSTVCLRSAYVLLNVSPVWIFLDDMRKNFVVACSTRIVAIIPTRPSSRTFRLAWIWLNKLEQFSKNTIDEKSTNYNKIISFNLKKLSLSSSPLEMESDESIAEISMTSCSGPARHG